MEFLVNMGMLDMHATCVGAQGAQGRIVWVLELCGCTG